MIAFPLADIFFAVGSSFRHRVYLLRFRLAHTIITNTAESQVQFPVTRIFVSHTAGPAIREISRVKRQSVCRSETPGNLHCGRVCTLRLWKCQGRQQRLSCSSSRAILPASDTVVWACDPTSIFFPKSTKRSAAAIFGRSAPSYVLWCTSEYSVVGRISCHVSHDNIGINVCQRSFAEFFLAAADSESNRFYPCF